MTNKSKKATWRPILLVILFLAAIISAGSTSYFYAKNKKLETEVSNQTAFLDSLQTNYETQLKAADAKVQAISGSLITLKGHIIDASQKEVKLLPGDTLHNIRKCYIVKSPQEDIIFVSSNEDEAELCETLMKILPENSGFQVIDIISEISAIKQNNK